MRGNRSAARSPQRWWEWFGCFAAWAWGYCLVNCFEPRLIGNGTHMPIMAMLLVASVLATILGCGSDPKRLSSAAAMSVPVGVTATAVMYMLPDSAYLLLCAISFLCLGPPLVRRLYGLVQVFDLRSRARVALPVVPAVFVFHAVWVELPLHFEAKFMILAVIGACSLWHIRSVSLWRVMEPGYSAPEIQVRPRGRVVLLVAYFSIFAVADVAYQILLTAVATESDVPYPLAWLLATVASGAVVSFGGIVTGTDAGRGWLLVGLVVTIAGLAAPLLTTVPDMEYIDLLTYSIGAGTALLVLLSFLPTVSPNRRLESLFASMGTIWIAVRGSLVILLQSQFAFMQDQGGPPPSWLLVATLLLTGALLFFSFVLLGRTATADMVAALMTLMSVPPRRRRSVESLVSDLDQEDRRMVVMLTDGQSRTEIAGRMSVPVAQIDERIAAIRRSLADPESGRRAEVLAQLAQLHGLTSREVEMIEDICDSKPNAQIASERFITERTVKFHIGHVLTKLDVANRREVRELVDRLVREARQ